MQYSNENIAFYDGRTRSSENVPILTVFYELLFLFKHASVKLLHWV